MARYTGPIFKKSRRYGFSILETGKEFAKGKGRTTAPGQHGARKVKLSDFGLHLYEKQKVRYMYGINERQFAKTFVVASKLPGVTGVNFLQVLESRLDNLVYRLGFAETRKQARQLVSHGHFLVDGKKVNIPSILISVGSKIELRAKSQENPQIKESLLKKTVAAWLTRVNFEGTFDRLPERAELNKSINETLIVEFYSK